MSLGAIIGMVSILTVVVGGFIYFLFRVIKSEKKQ
jgi:hypothetical protein